MVSRRSIDGLVNRAHAALAELPNDAIATL